jgi:hypothetical protein
MRASLLLLLGLGCSQAQSWFTGADHTAAAKPKESPLEALLTRAQAMAGDNMGETGIGFCAGAATGIVCKKVQSTLVNTALIGAAVCAGACLTERAEFGDVLEKAERFGKSAMAKAEEHSGVLTNLLHKFDNDGDGKADLNEAKITVSKFAKRHKGLTGGFIGGALLGYRLG